MSLMESVADEHYLLQKKIWDHVGYREDWRKFPMIDSRDQFWAVDANEREWFRHSPSKEGLEHWLRTGDYGQWSKKLYESSIYTQRHLPKWVYRGKFLCLAVVDWHSDQNQVLELVRTDHEVRVPASEISL